VSVCWQLIIGSEGNQVTLLNANRTVGQVPRLQRDRHSTIVVALLLVVSSAAAADPRPATDWPEFLGPGGRGHADPGSRIPLRWNDRLNVAWRTRVPGSGWSSPVVGGDQVWLTTATDRNRSLRLISLERTSGRIGHNVEVLRLPEPGRIHPRNGHATPTPVLVDGRVYVHFGAHGTACLESTGRVAWSRLLPYYHHHGPAGSAVAVGDLLVVACDGFTRPFYDRLYRPGIDDPQYVTALDRRTGRIAWHRPRVAGRHSYSTPLVLSEAMRPQLISAGGDRVVSYDPATGRELWWCRYAGYSVVPRPVAGDGLVYVCTGYDRPSLLAIRTDGTGDVTSTHVAWQTSRAVPLNSTPLLVEGNLYLLTDTGIASCLDAATGRLHWRRRLAGRFAASPLFVSGRILAIAENGSTHLLAPGPRYKRLALNRLKGQVLATPAVTGNRLIVRLAGEVICIAESGKPEVGSGKE